jgi:HNH endonuclease
MPKNRKPRNTRTKRAQDQPDEWVPVPTFFSDDGDKMVIVRNAQGQWKTLRLAEFIATIFIGPCPPGHVLRFKDGDRLNTVAENVEWVPSGPGPGPAVPNESDRS